MDKNKEDLKKISSGDEYYEEIKELCQNMPRSEFYPVFEEKYWVCRCGCKNSVDYDTCTVCAVGADKLRLIFSELFLMQKRNENTIRKRVSEKRKMEENAEKWRRIDPEVENIYQSAKDFEGTRDNYLAAAKKLETISGYKDASELAERYRELAESAPIYDAKTRKAMREKKVKKIFGISLISLLAALFIFVIAYFTLIAPRGIRYKIENGEATVVSYDMFFGGKHVKIPEKYLGRPVSAIGYEAFKDASALVSVEIPSTVKKIDAGAFANCKALKEIIIPESVSYVGSSAFSTCTSLKRVEIRGTIEVIEMMAFFECDHLAEITFESAPVRIEQLAFNKCSRLRDIRFSGSQEQWGSPDVESGNDEFIAAKLSFNYQK